MTVQWTKSYTQAFDNAGTFYYGAPFSLQGVNEYAVQGLATTIITPTPATWDNATSYNVGDVVAWNGTTWIATIANLNAEPGVALDWSFYIAIPQVVFQATSVPASIDGSGQSDKPLDTSWNNIATYVFNASTGWTYVSNTIGPYKWGRLIVYNGSPNAPGSIQMAVTLRQK
jgi:hypothetical protein